MANQSLRSALKISIEFALRPQFAKFVDAPRRQSGPLVVRIGVNVNNSLTAAPAAAPPTATSLNAVTDRRFNLTEVRIRTLDRLAEKLHSIGSRDEEMREWSCARRLLSGLLAAVDSDSSWCEGVCAGIDDDGALVLETPQGRQRCLAGTVTLLK
ncbi:hypothetical protein OAS39_02835 [Pirellulales bacterium]|nr:hypothetical protein [Pirellulales bacterium]